MTNILEATSFGATSTTDDVLSGVNLKGKRILVTGISAGIGMETARSLAAHGAQVVGAARDLNKAEAATEQVRKDAAANGGSFELVELDLANLKSVLACADRLLAKGEPLDVVIANAGVFLTIPAQTLKSPVRSLPVRSSPHLLTTLSPRPLSPSGKAGKDSLLTPAISKSTMCASRLSEEQFPPRGEEMQTPEATRPDLSGNPLVLDLLRQPSLTKGPILALFDRRPLRQRGK